MSSKSLFHPALMRRLEQVLAILILLGGVLAQTPLAVQAAPMRAAIGVTTTADEYGAGAGCSLREAIQAANTDAAFGGCPAGSGVDTITLPAGTYTLFIPGHNEQNNTTGDLDILSNLTIMGNPADPSSVVIQGGPGWDDKVIDINPNVDRVLTVTIDGVTVQNGHNTSNFDFYGGGIQAFGRNWYDAMFPFTPAGTLTLQNCVVTNNAYAGSTVVDEAAGGLLAEQINLTIDNCTFSNNSTTSGDGGGISIIGFNENVSITNSRFTGNSSPNNPGGAIYIRRSSSAGYPSVAGSIDLNRNLFTANSSNYGGAIYLWVQSGGNPVTLAVEIHYSRFAGNTATTSGSGLYYSGDAAVPTVDAENNWWSCNTGPSATPCNTAAVVGGVLDYDPWLVFGNAAVPATINVGGVTTLTAGFLHDSDNGAVPSPETNLTALNGLPVTWGNMVHGALSSQQLMIGSGGAATATLTNDNTCNNSSADATVDGVIASGTVTVQCAELTVTKTNDAGGSTALPTGWNWTLHVANGGLGFAAFANGSTLLTDTLPASAAGLTYGTPTISGATGLTGTVNCAIDGSSDLNCTAGTAVQLNAGGSFDVVIPVTPSVAGLFANPRPAGSCAVDPGAVVIETNDANNLCSNTVTVNTPPAITSADTTTFTVIVAGTFTVTTTPGYPTATTISIPPGSLPGGVTFTDNGDGTATLAGTPAAGSQGNYPFTITASNGVLPDATQSFILVVQPDLRITSADNTTFTIGSAGSFTVTTVGLPTPSLAESGALPSGVTFVDNGNGTGTLSGPPDAGTQGSYPITLTSHNGVSPDYVQNFTLTVALAPTITSANSVTFTAGTAGSFTVTTSGFPIPAISRGGAVLPSGVNFGDNGDGTATLSGTPAAGTGNVYNLTFTASNGTLPDDTQNFTLTVEEAPAITSPNNVTFAVGTTSSFTVMTTGYPVPAIFEAGTLPSGVAFVDNGNGTGTLSGTPAAGSQGTYPITITANNGVSPDATQGFTLTVNAAPAITSADNTTFTIGSAGSFTVTTTGAPTPAISIPPGSLPAGVTFTDNGDGTAALAGTPAAGTNGTYPFVITANNGVLPNATQNFTLTVSLAATTTTITSDLPDPSSVGQAISVTFTVTSAGPGTPSGNVTVSDGVDSCSVDAVVGTCSLALTTAGGRTLTAVYAGNSSFNGSTSAGEAHTVNAANTTTTITADAPDPSQVGEPVTVNYTVAVVAPGTGTPTGNVTVTTGADSCTGTVAAGSCTIVFTSAGAKTLTATYAGDASFTGSTSPAVGHTVNMASTMITITSDAPDPSVVGIPLPVNYSVTVVAPGSGTPTSSVTVTDGVDNCTGTVAAGACNLTLTTVGGRLLTATYSGDVNYGGSTSIPVPHTVEGPPGVTLINSVADTGDGQIAENEHTTAAITQLLVVFNKDMNADTPGDLDDALNPANYSLVQGASTVIPINGVITYNAATRTATLDVNGGVALPGGEYTLTVLGRIEDTLGVPIGTDFVRRFTIDTANPYIVGSGLAGQPGGMVITNGGAYSSHFTSFTVSFNEDVANAGGGAGIDDVANPRNYLLLRPGPDAVYDTTDCATFAANGDLPLGDDLRVPTGPVTYANNGGAGPFVVTVTVNGNVPLPDGEYRLLVCGTTSIVDLAGNPLNGGLDSAFTFRLFTAAAAPATGFAPGQVTLLPGQPASLAYADLGGLWIEIPSLGLRSAIVGVPVGERTWDVAWLYNQVGWLEGTAYPTWEGNSVLTAHAYTADGLPGPFVSLRSLFYDDRIIVHLGGMRYTYALRTNALVSASNTSYLTRHEEYSWLTLVTCQQYDERTGTYRYRRVVRAVLIGVTPDR
ncbi:MAG: Ig-like domain repeat protein [Anaerolineales bacterium]|nr:Ig-like domain repeat protein [Anaerolineales bacterium]